MRRALKNKWHPLSGKQKLAVVLACVVLLGLVGSGIAYASRGWLRGRAIPWAVERIYRPKIVHAHAEDFKDITPQLEQLGLKFGTPDGYNQDSLVCATFGYQGFNASYYCSKYRYSSSPTITSEYVANWNKNAPALERYLLQHGWQKVWNDKQPIDELFQPRHELGAGVNYEKYHGKLWCTLSIMRLGNAPTLDQERFYAMEICDRYVKFFGSS